MPRTNEAVSPESARELLDYVELVDFTTYKISGQVNNLDASDPDAEPRLMIRATSNTLEIRMQLELQGQHVAYAADISSVYQLLRPVNLWSSVVEEFVERVALMALYPVVREAVFATAARMRRATPVLGLIRAGKVSVNLDGSTPFKPSQHPATPRQLAREVGISVEELTKLLTALEIEIPKARKAIPGRETARVREVVARSRHPERFSDANVDGSA